MGNKKFLVAIDLTGDAQMIVQTASRLAGCFNATLQLIHVIEPIGINSPYELSPSLPADMQSVLVKRAEEFLNRLSEDLKMPDINRIVKIGSIKQNILSLAHDEGIDLIVVGTHGRHGIGLLLGSTATSVLHGTPCDVYAVKINSN